MIIQMMFLIVTINFIKINVQDEKEYDIIFEDRVVIQIIVEHVFMQE